MDNACSGHLAPLSAASLSPFLLFTQYYLASKCKSRGVHLSCPEGSPLYPSALKRARCEWLQYVFLTGRWMKHAFSQNRGTFKICKMGSVLPPAGCGEEEAMQGVLHVCPGGPQHGGGSCARGKPSACRPVPRTILEAPLLLSKVSALCLAPFSWPGIFQRLRASLISDVGTVCIP